MNKETSEIIKDSLNEVKSLIDVNVVIGKPMFLDEALVVPISKVKCAYISGGIDQKKENYKGNMPQSSLLASNQTITPVGFLVKEKDSVKVLHLENDVHILEYILDSGIDVIKTFIDLFKKKEKPE
ncbi:MAG: hypothetical protein IKC22_02905 [Bacilli bacterium]|nr:hypothetical protein [Bacilli bacterium]